MKAALVPLLPYAAVGAAISLVPWYYLYQLGVFDNPLLVAQIFMSPQYWLVLLITMPLTAIVYGAALVRAESFATGEPISLGASFARAGPRVVAIILAMICFLLVLAIGFALPVVPGLILMVSLFLFLPAIVLDRKGPVESLNYSHKLVWGNWWRTAAVISIAF